MDCLCQISQSRKQSENGSESCWRGKLTGPAGSTEAIHFPFSHQHSAACWVPGSKGQLGCLKVRWRRWVLHLLHSMRLHISVGQLRLITAAAQWARINWQSRPVCGPDQYMWPLCCVMVKCNQPTVERLVRIITMCIRKTHWGRPLVSRGDELKSPKGDFKIKVNRIQAH